MAQYVETVTVLERADREKTQTRSPFLPPLAPLES